MTKTTTTFTLAALAAGLLITFQPAEACWRHRTRARPAVVPRPSPGCLPPLNPMWAPPDAAPDSRGAVHPGPTTKLRVLLIGDTVAFPPDKGNAAAELSHVRAALGLFPEDRCDHGDGIIQLTGQAVNAENIIRTVRAWRVDPSEAIYCYLTSHGAYDAQLAPSDPSRGHYFDLSDGKLLQSVLLKELLGKRARLTVLMGDSCNKPGPPARAFTEMMRLTVTDPTFAESLFLGHTGVVNLNAAEIGKLAGTGIMSRAILQVFTTPQGGPDYERLRTWQGFLTQLSDQTFAESGKDYRPVVYQQDVKPAALPTSQPGPRTVDIPTEKRTGAP